MKSKTVALLLADLGATKSHSRPHVSNDNPNAAAQFKTLKYCSEVPDRFGSIEDTRTFCRTFFGWYNNEHRHSGIALLTPEMVHHGKAAPVIGSRANVLRAAYEHHPNRFKHKTPLPSHLPEAVWINKPQNDTEILTSKCSQQNG